VLHTWVSFRVADIYLPTPGEALAELGEETILVGKMTDSSDSGTEAGVFGIVELANAQSVIVSMEKLHPIQGEFAFPWRRDDSTND